MRFIVEPRVRPLPALHPGRSPNGDSDTFAAVLAPAGQRTCRSGAPAGREGTGLALAQVLVGGGRCSRGEGQGPEMRCAFSLLIAGALGQRSQLASWPLPRQGHP